MLWCPALTDKSRSADRAFQRAVAADGRIVAVRGHVLVKHARSVAEKMAEGAKVLDEIRDGFAPRPDDVGQSDG